MDNFTLFHLTFIADNPNPDPHFWSKSLQTAQVYAWRGLAFERVCLQHVEEIKHALGISGVLTRVFSWRHVADDVYPQGAQIDLIIERADHVVNLCEMKWTETPYAIEKSYYEQLQQKIAAFRTVTGYRHAIHLTLVSSCGVTPNKYKSVVQSEICLKQLFQ